MTLWDFILVRIGELAAAAWFWPTTVSTVAVILTALNLRSSNRNFERTLKHQENQLDHQRDKDRRDRLEAEKERRRQAVADLASAAFAILGTTSRLIADVAIYSSLSEGELETLAGGNGTAGAAQRFMEKVVTELPLSLSAYYSAKAKFHAVVPLPDRVPQLEGLETMVAVAMEEIETSASPKKPKSVKTANLNQAIQEFVEAQSDKIRQMTI